MLAPYFERYSADGGDDLRSTPRGGGARGGLTLNTLTLTLNLNLNLPLF